MLLIFTGCSFFAPEKQVLAGSDSSPQDESSAISAEEVVVAEMGWCALPHRLNEPAFYQYSASLQNPNDLYDMHDTTVVIEGKDDDGKVVFTQEERIPLIAAGDTCLYAGRAGNGTEVTSLELSVAESTPQQASTPKTSDMYNIESVIENIGGSPQMNYAGTIEAISNPPEGFNKAKICVLLRDQVGGLTAGYSIVVSAPAEGESIPFTVPAPGVPQHSSYEVGVIPWK